MNIANTPKPPYYAVIFTSIKNSETEKYDEVSKRMIELVSSQEGFLGFESAQEKIGITISYWSNLNSIANWKNNFEHQEAQKLGKEKFYQTFKVRISKIERDYKF